MEFLDLRSQIFREYSIFFSSQKILHHTGKRLKHGHAAGFQFVFWMMAAADQNRIHAGGMRHFRDGDIARPAEGSTPEARVRAVLAEIAASLELDEVRTRTLMRAIYSGEPDVAAGRHSAAESFRTTIEAAIGDEDGVRGRDMIVETLGLVVHGAMLAWLDGRYDGSDVGRLLDNAVTLVFRGRST